jgi:hypothetical protein
MVVKKRSVSDRLSGASGAREIDLTPAAAFSCENRPDYFAPGCRIPPWRLQAVPLEDEAVMAE